MNPLTTSSRTSILEFICPTRTLRYRGAGSFCLLTKLMEQELLAGLVEVESTGLSMAPSIEIARIRVDVGNTTLENSKWNYHRQTS